MINDLIFTFLATFGAMTTLVGLGWGIGAGLHHLTRMHADRVAAKTKPVYCGRCAAYAKEHGITVPGAGKR